MADAESGERTAVTQVLQRLRAGDPNAEETFETLYRVVAGQMRDLMEVLMGEDAV